MSDEDHFQWITHKVENKTTNLKNELKTEKQVVLKNRYKLNFNACSQDIPQK